MTAPTQQSLTFAPLGARVLISHNGVPFATIGWQAAKEHAIELKRKAQSSADAQVGYVLPTDARALGLDCERSIAAQIAAALHQAGAFAEEFDARRAEQLVQDGALLLRLGVPVGLTDNTKIQAEAAKEAAWNTQLRRAVPAGVKATSIVGTPSLVRGAPPATKH